MDTTQTSVQISAVIHSSPQVNCGTIPLTVLLWPRNSSLDQLFFNFELVAKDDFGFFFFLFSLCQWRPLFWIKSLSATINCLVFDNLYVIAQCHLVVLMSITLTYR